MPKPTFVKIQKQARETHTLYKKQFAWRLAFEYSTEEVFNRFDVPKRYRLTLRTALALVLHGPNKFRKEKATNPLIEECVRMLYHFGFGVPEAFDEAFRQYRVCDFKEKERFRGEISVFVGKSGGTTTAKIRRKQKASPPPTLLPEPLLLLFLQEPAGNRPN